MAESGDEIRISIDPADLELDWIHEALSKRAHWALGRSRADAEASIASSICFGVFRGAAQIGFARVVTDGMTFAWLCDVFVDEKERGSGIGSRLVETILADPRLSHVRRMALATSDAASLYRRFAFEPLDHPERWRRIDRPAG